MTEMVKFFLFALILLCLSQAQAEPLGRLFFTPEERAAMSRESPISGLPVAGAADDAAPVNSLTFNGYVKRSSGKSTLWLNGHAQREHDAPKQIAVSENNRAPGEFAVKLPDSSRVYSLKPGQTLTPGSGEIRESYRRTPLPAIPAKPGATSE